MYSKFGNTLIAEDMNDLPIDELKPLIQVMIIDQYPDDHIDKTIDYSTHMILKKVMYNKLYIFGGIKLDPYLYFSEEKEDMTEEDIEDAGYERAKDFEAAYLLLPNNRFFKIDGDRTRFDYEIIGEEEYNNTELLEDIYNTAFSNTDLFNVNKFYNKGDGKFSDKSYFYLTTKLDDDNVLVLLLEHDIRPQTYRWNTSHNAILMSRDRKYSKVTCDAKHLYGWHIKKLNGVKISDNEYIDAIKTYDQYCKVGEY